MISALRYGGWNFQPEDHWKVFLCPELSNDSLSFWKGWNFIYRTALTGFWSIKNNTNISKSAEIHGPQRRYRYERVRMGDIKMS